VCVVCVCVVCVCVCVCVVFKLKQSFWRVMHKGERNFVSQPKTLVIFGHFIELSWVGVGLT